MTPEQMAASEWQDDVALERANKKELREIVRSYRFLFLSVGLGLEELARVEAEAMRRQRVCG